MRVSRPVHLPVHVGVSPDPSNQAAATKPVARGPGPYLAKSGSVYIFQIKLPKTSGGTKAIPPLRLSLGACSHRRARLLADLLAAKARLMFDSMRHGSGMQDDEDSEMRAREFVIEMKGELKAYLGIIDRSDAPIPVEELQKAAGIRDLVNLNRELEKKAQGEPFNELITGNEEILKQSAVAKLSASSALSGPASTGQFNLPKDLNAERNVPALLEAIGLAHDLGNPPFGHQGEDAIQSWMKAKAPEIFEGLDEAALREDFLKFEGNAQAFRLLTRLQIVNDSYGLNMTYAFLAALMKYPSPSDKVNKKVLARKKFNYFQSEADIAKEVWAETGLAEGIRHPLTFIMEACDDIAYSIVDVEDAAKKGLVNFDRLAGFLEFEGGDDACVTSVITKAREQHHEFRAQSLSAAELDDITMQMFRVNAIGVMIVAATKAFADNLPAMMAGKFDKELMAESDAKRLWALLKGFAGKYIYPHRQVLEVELKGHQTIHGLMDIFWAAIINRKDPLDIGSKRTSPLHSYVYSRISENYRRVAESPDNRMPIRYRELQLMTDMMSGMTDGFAISMLTDLRERGAV